MLIDSFPANKIIFELLPPALRKVNIYSFLQIAFSGLVALFTQFNSIKNTNRNIANWNSSYLALETILNEIEAPNQSGNIFITLNPQIESTPILLREEAPIGNIAPCYLSSENQNSLIAYLFTELQANPDFTINLPTEFINTPELNQLFFRLSKTLIATTTYNLSYY